MAGEMEDISPSGVILIVGRCKDGKTRPLLIGCDGRVHVDIDQIVQVELDDAVRMLLSLIPRLAVDSAGRLRVLIDAAGTSTPVSATMSGTWNLGNMPVDQRYEMQQRANIEFDAVQRSKMAFS